MLLGGSGLGAIKGYSQIFINIESQNIIGILSILGYTLYMFISGVKMDMGMIGTTGKKALTVGIISLLAPLLLGMATAVLCMKVWFSKADYLPFVAVTHSLTPFPVIASLLSDLKILNSELGRMALSSAIVSDLCSIFLTTVAIVARTGDEKTSETAMVNFVSVAVFVLVVFYILRPAMFWVIKQTPEGRPVNNVFIYAIILGLFACGLCSNMFGQYVMFGAFIFGLAVPDGPPLGSALVEKLDTMVSIVLMPVFIATCAMRTNLFHDNNNEKCKEILANFVVILVSVAAKMGACFVPLVYFCKMPRNDALALGLIMSAKGTVNFATQILLRDSGVSKSASQILPLSWN